MKITENIPLSAKWLEPRENAVETVLFLYNTICHRFINDEAYGVKFVEKNQELIGQLVNAAVIEVAAKSREE